MRLSRDISLAKRRISRHRLAEMDMCFSVDYLIEHALFEVLLGGGRVGLCGVLLPTYLN